MASNRTAPTAHPSRDSETARKPWTPPSALDAPPPPEGYAHRWIRAEMRGAMDSANMSARFREGWTPVRAEEYPDFVAPTIQDGKHAGIIGTGGLILCRIPLETTVERNNHYNQMATNQARAVDAELQKNVPSDALADDRKTQIAFGGMPA